MAGGKVNLLGGSSSKRSGEPADLSVNRGEWVVECDRVRHDLEIEL